MGVYSDKGNVYSEVSVPTIEPDTRYFGVDGANRILYEAALNDMALFDAVIANDIQQAYVEHAITEGADLSDELVSLQEAATGGIFSRLKDFLKKIWEKITGLIMSFVRKIQGAVTSDNKKLVDKFKKTITINSTKLKKMKFKWSDQKSKDFTFNKPLTVDEVSKTTTKYREDLFGICSDLSKRLIGVSVTNKNSTLKITENTISQIVDARKNLEKDLDKEDWEDSALSDYVPNTTTDDFVKDAHEYFFDDEEEKDGDFSKYQTDIMSSLTNSKDLIKTLNKEHDEIDKHFRKVIKEAENYANYYAKYIGKDGSNMTFLRANNVIIDNSDKDNISYSSTNKANNTTAVLTYGNSNIDSINKANGSPTTANAELTKAGNTLQRCYSMLQGIVTKLINAQMAAVTFHIKQCRRVWIQAASFAERPVKEDAILFDAIGEAADFDTDQLIGY